MLQLNVESFIASPWLSYGAAFMYLHRWAISEAGISTLLPLYMPVVLILDVLGMLGVDFRVCLHLPPGVRWSIS